MEGEGTMAALMVTGADGMTRTIEASGKLMVMQIMWDAGFEELLAQCGGCLSCATCHVIVHPDDYHRVGPHGEEENELLDSSDVRTPTSRLSCRFPFVEDLHGSRVTVAQEG